MEKLRLGERTGLPQALRVLYQEFPREAWETHPGFSGLVQFWMERHAMFRKLLELLETDAAAMLGRQLDPSQYPARLSRFGSMLVNDLHGHHQIEDVHYFPQLKVLDDRIGHGFDILDSDHQQMDGFLSQFAEAANTVLGQAANETALRDAVGSLQGEVASLHLMLLRHLEDEEDLVVPVILKSAASGGFALG